MSETIAKPWRVDRDLSPMDVIKDTGRKLYVSEGVVTAMPRGEGEEGETIFFRLNLFGSGRQITDAALDKEYELRDLVPEFPDNLAAVNKADPSFGDAHPNATHWRDTGGTWCYAAFLRRPMPSENDSRARSNANLIPYKPGQSGNPNGRGHFHAQALRMARDMTPAAIRRLGELGGLLPGPDGQWIPLEKLDIDARVIEIACITLVERTMGKPKEFDPAAEREPSALDLSKLTADQRQQLRELLTKAIASNTASTVAADATSASDETTIE